MRKILLSIIIILFSLVVIMGGKGNNSGTIEVNDFEVPVVIQTEVDPYFPCHIESQTKIVCEAINITQQERFKEGLNFLDKARLFLLGVPISNIEGSVVGYQRITLDSRNEINLDLSKKGGIFKIGFNSNVFSVTTISGGVHNNTELSGSNVQLQSGQLTGTYRSIIMDLNTTQAVINATWSGGEPAGSDLDLRVRTHNLTEGDSIAYGLRGYWKFDSSNLVDYSGYNASGTIVGANTKINKTGKYDSAVSFPGQINNYVNLGDPTSLRINDEITVMVWVYPGPTSAADYEARIITKWQTFVRDNWALQLNYNKPKIRISPGCTTGYNDLIAGSAITAGTWSHVAFTYSEATSTAKIYVNGVEVKSGSFSADLCSDAGHPVYIGGHVDHNGDYVWFDGKIDEVAIYNRTLDANNISYIYNNQLKAWNDWSDVYESSPATTIVEDGRYAQIETTFNRDNTGINLYLSQFSIGYDAAGTTPTADNPPITTLETADLKAFTTTPIELNASATDDQNVTNMTLYHNASGSWAANITINISLASSGIRNFTIANMSDGLYEWNVYSCDNATTTQCSWATYNRTFTVDTICDDADCYPYVCDTGTNLCYTSCSQHSSCNSSSYCDDSNSCVAKISDGSSCQGNELDGLLDNNVCIGGYCFNDNIPTTGEYCTDVSNGCVDDGVEYANGDIQCKTGNDYYQCNPGGDVANPWSFTDCRDAGDPYNGVATYTEGGHTYCGYYNAETCSVVSGCVAQGTIDCGNYFYNETSGTCGSGTNGCDVGCGASYDLETCPPPNTLAADCSSCTPPATDDPPAVTLTSPADTSTSSSTSIIFQYTVSDENPLKNCSLWYEISGSVAWHLNKTNSSAISRSSTNSFTATILPDSSTVIWNVECYDSLNQSSFNSSSIYFNDNFTVSIDTTYVETLELAIYNNSDSPDNLLFSVNERGIGNFTGDVYIGGDARVSGHVYSTSPVKMDELTVQNYLDINSSDVEGVRITNPFEEYISFRGMKGSFFGDILFNLFYQDPHITTHTGSQIYIDKPLNITANLSLTDKITFRLGETIENIINDWIKITGNLYVTENLNVSKNISIADTYKIYSNGSDLIIE